MSVTDYETILPDVFQEHPVKHPKSQKTGASGSNADVKSGRGFLGNGPASRGGSSNKGFIDLVELQKSNSDGGIDIQTLPAARFVPQGAKNKGKEKDYSNHALVLRRTISQDIDARLRLLRVELEIQSSALCAALRDIVCDSYEQSDFRSVPIRVSSPFYEIFFYRKEIEELAEKQEHGTELFRDLHLLVDFIRKNGLLSCIVDDHVRYTEKGQIPADIVWSIYPPNSVVVFRGDLVQECWIVRNVVRLVDEHGIYWWQVSGFRVGCNGRAPGLVRQTAIVARVTTALLTISDLKLVPTQHFRDWERLRPTLMTRANLVRHILGDTLCDYRTQTYIGTAWEGIDPARTYDDSIPSREVRVKQINERVVVDITAFKDNEENASIRLEDLRSTGRHQTGQNTERGRGIVIDPVRQQPTHRFREPPVVEVEPTPNLDIHEVLAYKPFAHSTKIQTAEDIGYDPSNFTDLVETVRAVLNVPEERLLLIFPALLPSFGLKSKKWRWVLADKLQDVAWGKAAFESLQLNPDSKKLIECLVDGHKNSVNTGFDDIVVGKGQGLVFMLHGDAGLGKTLTAEGIADYLRRPLYSISGGEITTDVDVAEDRLDRIFSLTHRWDAVSLLDEADVLLCKRNSHEMQRNAIVGVFLRKLEYFQGVLFLTTNRKEDFDEAFKSRIHVTISYPALNHAARSTIWRNLIDKNTEAGVKVDAAWTTTHDVFETLGALDLNGRTIKNILRTAVAYAYGEKRPLSARHVWAILQTELSEASDSLAKGGSAKEIEQVKRADMQKTLGRLKRLVEGQDGQISEQD